MRVRDQQYWIDEFRKMSAFWAHDGDPKRPHALLTTSGMHSNGFFDAEQVLEDATLVSQATQELLNLLRGHDLDHRVIDCVVGPAMGAVSLAHDLSRHVTNRRGLPVCRNVYAEKEIVNGEPAMAFKRRSVRKGECVLIVEDVITSGGSVEVMAEAVSRAGALVVPFVASLVNRSGLEEVGGKQIVSLVNYPMPRWKPEECPLCKQNSEAIWPKGLENWQRLNAEY
ncbi:hypothetical protein KW800_02375 [Candidatus Parcubacteria bacterium]|nr:hypothetical protein [Candidatus Parcubacteria bacterium]